MLLIELQKESLYTFLFFLITIFIYLLLLLFKRLKCKSYWNLKKIIASIFSIKSKVRAHLPWYLVLLWRIGDGFKFALSFWGALSYCLFIQLRNVDAYLRYENFSIRSYSIWGTTTPGQWMSQKKIAYTVYFLIEPTKYFF